MGYYWLVQSTGEDIGNASSQVKGMKEAYQLYADNSVWKLPFLKKPYFKPDFDALQLYGNARVTDIIVPTGLISMTGIFLSEKTRQLLQNFKLPEHIYYEAKVLHKNKVRNDFYWIQFIEEFTSQIDFENSTFDLKKAFGWQNWIDVKNNLRFKNTAELIDCYKSKSTMEDIIPRQLSINSDYDFLCFRYFGNYFLIKEELKKAFEANEIKGVELIPFN